MNQDAAPNSSPKAYSCTPLSTQARSFLRRGVVGRSRSTSAVSSSQNKNQLSQTAQVQANNDFNKQKRTTQQKDLISNQEKLDVLEQTIDEVETKKETNQQIDFQEKEQSSEQLNPPSAAGARKEGLESGAVSLEAGTGLQYVEQEKSPEIPPEVERYIQKVDQGQVKPPEEIVVADQAQPQTKTKHAAQPVIVLPITPEIEKKGKKKPPTFSVRWLVAWSKKIIKMFSGKVIYRQAG